MSERRINIRVESRLFDALDDERQRQRTTFQEVGLTLWKRWLRGEIPDEKDEQKMKTGTKTAESRHQIGTFNEPDAPIDHKIVQKSTGQGTDPGGQETDHLTESESGRNPAIEIPIRREDLARIATALETIIRTQREQSRSMGELAAALKGSKKTTKRANRDRRLDSRRERKHPPRFESGA